MWEGIFLFGVVLVVIGGLLVWLSHDDPEWERLKKFEEDLEASRKKVEGMFKDDEPKTP